MFISTKLHFFITMESSTYL